MISSASSTASKPVLVFNSAEDRIQLVLGQQGEILFAQEALGSGRTIQVLPRAIQCCFQQTGLGPGDLSGVACVQGPGTFTGLRVSIALAAGLARGADLPLAGLAYLPLIAAGPARRASGEVWVCTYARKGLIYVQGFAAPQALPLFETRVLGLEEAAQLMEKREQRVGLVGSGIGKNDEYWRKRLPGSTRMDPRLDHPSAHELLQAAEQADYSREPVRPIYLRSADAEVNIPRLAALRGIGEEDFTRRIPDF